MSRTIEKTVFTFDELSETAKEKAREWYREGALDYEWYDAVYKDAMACAKILGIDITKIYFSGFSSQGDGACFKGSYSYAKEAPKAIKAYAPNDKELLRIAYALQSAQRKAFYQLYATTEHRGHYYHSGCMAVSVEHGNRDVSEAEEDTVTQALRDFAGEIYVSLEKEYEWLDSDEQVDENIIANEYEFTKEGASA